MKLCPAFELCSCVTFTHTCKSAYVHSPHCFWFGFHTLPPQIDTECYVISECQTAVQDLPSSPGLPHTPLHHIIYMPPGIPIIMYEPRCSTCPQLEKPPPILGSSPTYLCTLVHEQAADDASANPGSKVISVYFFACAVIEQLSSPYSLRR